MSSAAELKYENALFELLMSGVIEDIGKEALLEKETLENGCDLEVSKELDEKCMKLISGRKRKRARTWKKAIMLVAAIIAVTGILTVTAVSGSPGLGKGTFKYVVDYMGGLALDIRYRNEDYEGTYIVDDGNPFSFDNETTIEAGWLPDGFQINELSQSDVSTHRTYETSDGTEKLIEISKHLLSDSFSMTMTALDGEIKSLNVNGHIAIHIVSYREIEGIVNNIMWIDEENNWKITVLTYGISEEDAIKVAENLIL